MLWWNVIGKKLEHIETETAHFHFKFFLLHMKMSAVSSLIWSNLIDLNKVTPKEFRFFLFKRVFRFVVMEMVEIPGLSNVKDGRKWLQNFRLRLGLVPSRDASMILLVEKNPAIYPVDIENIPLFTRFYISQMVVWDFFHQQKSWKDGIVVMFVRMSKHLSHAKPWKAQCDSMFAQTSINSRGRSHNFSYRNELDTPIW